jgi:coproporphyrinogen III oxidase
MNPGVQTKDIAQLYSTLQRSICQTLEVADGRAKFKENRWENAIGSGVTCVLRNGDAIEKGGVNFSFVEGDFTPQMERLLGEKASSYAATGISSIMHPKNPHVPIIHMNVRFFSLNTGTQWFGGGIDLTPHYVDATEAGHFHRVLKKICDKYRADFYPRFKQWADDYFYLPHRSETRGIGGIFFDRLTPDTTVDFGQLLDFTRDLALIYPELYRDMLQSGRNKSYSKKQKLWQELRRGRYVEFNLAYDRGTKFGFESNGNAESILISLPSTAAWEYKHPILKDSEEEKTQKLLQKGIDWINH